MHLLRVAHLVPGAQREGGRGCEGGTGAKVVTEDSTCIGKMCIYILYNTRLALSGKRYKNSPILQLKSISARLSCAFHPIY